MFTWPNLLRRKPKRPEFISTNPLVPASKLLERWINNGASWYNNWGHTRGTGRSTAQAFDYLALAMRNPHQWHKVEDHSRCHFQSAILCARLQDYIRSLGLDHFIVAGGKISFGSVSNG